MKQTFISFCYKLKIDLKRASKQKGGVNEVKNQFKNRATLVNNCSKVIHMWRVNKRKKIALRKRGEKLSFEKKSRAEVAKKSSRGLKNVC